MMVRDGVEADILASLSMFANAAASFPLSLSKNGGKKVSGRIVAMAESALPYADMSGSAEASDHEMLEKARKEQEIAAMNPNMTARDFLLGRR